MATNNNYLKQISLSITNIIHGASFTLPSDILSCENLTKIRDIKCVSLQELHLDSVHITQEILDAILSSCSLLEKIELLHCTQDLNTIKVKNLPCLHKLQIALDASQSTVLEISGVPNLAVFIISYDVYACYPQKPRIPFNAHSISLGISSRVTQLTLGAVITDYACLDIFKSGGFPFLESLTLGLTSWMLRTFHFTCASIKILFLESCPPRLTDVQVYAPKLLVFHFHGQTLPSTLLFPVSSLEETNVSLFLDLPLDANFCLKLRKTFTLSRKCYLRVTTNFKFSKLCPFDIDVDDLRRRLRFTPATNVQELWFRTVDDECLWKQSPFFHAFFEICYPKYVFAHPDSHFKHNNHFCRFILREVLEKKTRFVYWPHYLKHVQFRSDRDQQWKTLTNSQRSIQELSAPDVLLQFKLKWR